jgi:hypothetical protein
MESSVNPRKPIPQLLFPGDREIQVVKVKQRAASPIRPSSAAHLLQYIALVLLQD